MQRRAASKPNPLRVRNWRCSHPSCLRCCRHTALAGRRANPRTRAGHKPRPGSGTESPLRPSCSPQRTRLHHDGSRHRRLRPPGARGRHSRRPEQRRHFLRHRRCPGCQLRLHPRLLPPHRQHPRHRPSGSRRELLCLSHSPRSRLGRCRESRGAKNDCNAAFFHNEQKSEVTL